MFRLNMKQLLRYNNLFTRKCPLKRPPLIQCSTQIKLLSTQLLQSNVYCDNNSALRRVIMALAILQWLGFEKDDEEKESELIMTLKRAVLCTRREEYDKAEQMLHLALRLAQQQQNSQGVVYCYDLMANLALDRLQLEKAEKLFISVMQMLLSTEMEQDNLKIIHISLKLARIAHLLAQEEKAELGYQWCLDKIRKKQATDYDSRVLHGVIEDWYAQFLLDRGNVKESIIHLEEAYKICCEVQGQHTEKSMLLLNDLGITSWRAGELKKAKLFLTEAEITGRSLEDQSHVGVIKANLGLIYLQNGLTEKATQSCKEAFKLGTKYENVESIEQAKYCLEQIKITLEK